MTAHTAHSADTRRFMDPETLAKGICEALWTDLSAARGDERGEVGVKLRAEEKDGIPSVWFHNISL